ncbi:restriction endonuclease PLD domain-containing protein [Winogradskyella algicola]|uniref:restriction endonuclease PLD domain-containing protein n=1 Tax=Winogradskyella algicola TaxID=2575815 RepID=UPI001109CEFA|nr:phospholipase D family protein [Winogradskyella algicola]
MEIRFIGQGYNRASGSSVASAIIDSLNNSSYNSFKCLVAFASHTGVSGLTQHILDSKTHINDFRVIVGIDQFGTSSEALESLIEWDVETFVFYTNQRIIFHPKIYLFEGNDLVSVIIGSNNLTQSGLAQNIEGAIQISYNKNEEDLDVLNQIIDYYSPILTGDSPYLRALDTELIENLVANGKVKDEANRRAQYTKEVETNNELNETEQTYPAINDLFGTLPLQGLPSGFSPTRLTRGSSNETSDTNSSTSGSGSPATPILTPPIIATSPGWTYNDNSNVLVAEIGGPSRWKQISFAKRNFETFFELPTAVGTNGDINLKYIDTAGNIDANVEQITSARVKASRNFNLEPEKVRECTVAYNRAHRPIIVFIKINSTDFIYHFETHGTQLYNELEQVLVNANGVIKRTEITLNELRQSCPSLSI